MPITNDQQYQQAQSVFAAGTAKDMPRLQKAILEYERGAGISDEADPAPPQEAPKPGPQGFWKPERPLAAPDFIPQDVGGKLAVWRDMPLAVYQRKVVEPQRMAAIAAGQKAMTELQRFGPGAFSPEDQVQRTMLIAQGKAAEAQDPGALTEDDPGYQQFNEQQWQQAVQQRAQDPEAGPIQRLEKLDTSSFAGKVAYGTEKVKDYTQAGARGLLDMATLGFGTGASDAITEAVSGREAVDVSRGLEEAHPVTAGIGAGIGAVTSPTTAGPALMRAIYAKAAPKAGRLGAAVLSGGAGTAAEGLGRDLSAEAADALSDAPEAVLDQGRLEPERLATSTALRGGLGGVAGALGHGVTRLGEGLANKISERTIRGTEGRSPYEFSEQMGWDYDPVLGIRIPQYIKQQQASTRETGVPWAERFADKARPGFVENVDKLHVAEKAAMGHENLAYFKSVKGQTAPISNVSRTATEIAGELQGVNPRLARRVTNLARELDPMMSPEQMGRTIKRLSGEVQRSGKDEETAEVMGRLQAALMEDMKGLPKGNLGEGGWPALRQAHDVRRGFIEEARELGGAREEGASLPSKVAEMNKNFMNQGRRGFPVAKEQTLDRFMPPELKHEALMLRAANMVDDISSGNAGPYPSRAGMIDWARGQAVPRAYGLGRAVSKPLPDHHPISDKMFSWVNARAPRATVFVPGMNMQQMVMEQMEMQGRPKRWGDLSPEQQKLLLDALGTPDQQETLGEAQP